MLKIIEWLGFIICVGSVFTNGYLRSQGHHNLMEQFTFYSVFGGASITIAAFFIRKRNTRKNRIHRP
ncbi:hypothetical protein CD30_06110 [Ureibacillus massiliensis 4400831 = CIP 108448 = CCUG 49529]|uniref:Uncharacterized protein n=1 Tax=Ureibacillus massiliensis 4400831 = CIP 108448 = CCUG 49529 TaxID=1211035 RepID=A0A0A3J899_9BACL|nr:hypothetical protein [Ureibacillus massiliensis]KGR91388.1 hypothetical protein CD30_06110 [Ureibacillus massiliensis 4400831 = CIP 108448 = CCUG 49529]RKJ10572.1 hypothetical protein D7X33_49425 [Butyricicoccus sp. 1XD8-22]